MFKILTVEFRQPGFGEIVKFGDGGVLIIIGPTVVNAGGKQGFVIVIEATNELGVEPEPVGLLPQDEVVYVCDTDEGALGWI